MSKKQPQPQKVQQTKNKSVIVDQQNEPFLRTIFKRVRNINKKLTQITELKNKQDLKPQQIQKLNRKAEYESERSRLENIADFFREVYAENAEHYKNNQLQQLDALAQAVAVLRGNFQLKESEKLYDLNKALTEKSSASLAESTKNISEVLRRFANDYKLKKSLIALIEQNPTQKISQVKPEPVVEQVQEVPVKVQTVPEPVPTPVKVEEPVKVPKQVEVVVEQKIEEKQGTQLQATTESKLIEGQEGQKGAEEGKKYRGDRPKGEYRPRNNNRKSFNRDVQNQGEGQEGGERRRYNNGEKRQRANYRPKQQNQPQNREEDSDSSLEREPQLRNFRKEEIRKLEDDGFTVVGKPKPKAQDQKQWYEHTHGQKQHYHQRKEKN